MTKAYYRFLWSDEWREIRARKLEAQGNKCERCKYPDRSNDVHHIFYDGNNDLKDLMVLCSLCHSLWHTRHPKHAMTHREAADRKEEFIQKERKKKGFRNGFINEKKFNDLYSFLKKKRIKNSS